MIPGRDVLNIMIKERLSEIFILCILFYLEMFMVFNLFFFLVSSHSTLKLSFISFLIRLNIVQTLDKAWVFFGLILLLLFLFL